MREVYLEIINSRAGSFDVELLNSYFSDEDRAENLHLQSIEAMALAGREGLPLEDTRHVRVINGNLAIMNLFGPIFPRANMMTLSGATSIEQYANDFIKAYENPNIKGIIHRVDSPGGDVRNIGEASYLMHKLAATKRKPVWTYAEGYLCSAAYYVGSAVNVIYGNKSSMVGSIGVVLTTQKNDDNTIEIVSNKNKRPDPSSEEGRKLLERQVFDLADNFRADVARNRRISVEKVVDKYGEGEVFVGPRAKTQGLLDEVRETFGEVIEEMEALIASNIKGKVKAVGTTLGTNEESEDDMNLREKLNKLLGASGDKIADDAEETAVVPVTKVEEDSAAAVNDADVVKAQEPVKPTREELEERFEAAAELFSTQMVMSSKLLPANQPHCMADVLNAMIDDTMIGGKVGYADTTGTYKEGTRADAAKARYQAMPKHNLTAQTVASVRTGQTEAHVLTETDEETVKQTVIKDDRRASLLNKTTAGRATLKAQNGGNK